MNTKADVSFGVRASLKIQPFMTLIFGVTFVIVIFGLATQVFEYYNFELINSLDKSGPATNSGFSTVMQKFSDVYNSFWLMLVTMTTSKIYFNNK
jgi:hypothetical protein